jgi:hypothetical protein
MDRQHAALMHGHQDGHVVHPRVVSAQITPANEQKVIA